MTDEDRRQAEHDRRVLLTSTRVAGGRRQDDPLSDIDALLARVDIDIAAARRLLDVAVVARRLEVTAATVRNWILTDRLEAVRTPTGRYRVPVSELARILKTQASQASKTQSSDPDAF